ncbi:hypothetical protein CEXT_416631 [Caerostris extrusa]|uniref:Uncharacterized protein n=1 Tax=Caerostris extrusa TaxID=172846 RepID=A0AAV4N681_CAEEX|nr:hypothetical protein CEXT_416631 [Caerostris extrusa]
MPRNFFLSGIILSPKPKALRPLSAYANKLFFLNVSRTNIPQANEIAAKTPTYRETVEENIFPSEVGHVFNISRRTYFLSLFKLEWTLFHRLVRAVKFKQSGLYLEKDVSPKRNDELFSSEPWAMQGDGHKIKLLVWSLLQ